ncbi:MAG: HAD-IB family hydrolase [Pseudomonadota bacterium]
MKRSVDHFIDDIYASEEGPSVVAFFDFDNTLISGFSAKSFLIEQLRSGTLSPQGLGSQVMAAMKFTRGDLNFSGLIAKTAQAMRGQREEVFQKLGEDIHKKSLAGAIYPEARRLLDAHRAMGHTIAIVSSATKYQIVPTARELDIEYILCTELEVRDGVFTGRAHSPTCFGDGKLWAAEDFCEDFDASLEASFFYTDSADDLPLVEAVGRPRIVNPDKELKKQTQRRGWPMTDFGSRGRPDTTLIAKTAATYGLLPTALAATAPLPVFKGDKRDALNMANSVWTELSSYILGLKFDVEGSQYLHSDRPAVFIFNHQSSMDALIMAKLVQKNFTGIGKAEIKDFPVIGPALAYTDMVFIDRANSKNAIEAMKPVVDAITEDRLSVCIAPEGTRSVGRRLGGFKKGPFHIAMQAGVPIVPVVIHNSADSLPKGQNIARPANIRISVLQPIDVSDWTHKNMEKKIAAVRGEYLETLGQTDLLEAS